MKGDGMLPTSLQGNTFPPPWYSGELPDAEMALPTATPAEVPTPAVTVNANGTDPPPPPPLLLLRVTPAPAEEFGAMVAPGGAGEGLKGCALASNVV